MCEPHPAARYKSSADISDRRALRNREQLPVARHAFEARHTTFSKSQTRARHKVFDGRRDEHFTRLGLLRHAGADMYCDPPRFCR